MPEEEFTIGFESQKEWGWLIALALFLCGLGAGLFIVSLFVDYHSGAALGILIVLLGALALFLDLGRPLRFWRAVVKPTTSWISRGTILIILFAIFGILYVAPAADWLGWLPWSKETALGQAFMYLAGLCAFLVTIYTGFLLSAPPAIPIWNSIFVPVQFFLYALLGGVTEILTMRAITGETGPKGEWLQAWQVGLVAGSLALVLAYLGVMASSTVASQQSVRLLVQGPLALHFWVGVLLIGLVVPLATALYAYLGAAGQVTVLLVVNAIFVLIGSYLFRYTVLRAGLYSPLL